MIASVNLEAHAKNVVLHGSYLSKITCKKNNSVTVGKIVQVYNDVRTLWPKYIMCNKQSIINSATVAVLFRELNFFYIKLNSLIWYNSGNASGQIVYVIIIAVRCFRCLFYFIFTVGHVNAETSQGAKRIRIDALARTCITAYTLLTVVSPNRLSFVFLPRIQYLSTYVLENIHYSVSIQITVS